MVQIKTTDYMRGKNTLLAKCNRNFVTRPFSRQKKAYASLMPLKCKILNYDAIIDVLLIYEVL